MVEDVKLDVSAKRVDFDVSCLSAELSCPACGAASQPVHDWLRRSGRRIEFYVDQGALRRCRARHARPRSANVKSMNGQLQ